MSEETELERLRAENTLLRNALVDTLVARCFSDLKYSTLKTIAGVISCAPLCTGFGLSETGLHPKTLLVLEHILYGQQATKLHF